MPGGAQQVSWNPKPMVPSGTEAKPESCRRLLQNPMDPSAESQFSSGWCFPRATPTDPPSIPSLKGKNRPKSERQGKREIYREKRKGEKK